MTKTKSQKARAAAARKGPAGNTTSSSSNSNSGSKSRKAKRQKNANTGSPLAGPKSGPGTGIKGFDSHVIEVEQWLNAVNTGVQTGASVLQSFYLNPQSFVTAGRLAKLAALYERFQFESFEASYKPNVAYTNQGSLFLALDLDPEDSLVQLKGMNLMNSVTAMQRPHHDFGPVYKELKVRASGKVDFPMPMFVDPDRNGDRLAYSGRLVVGNVSSFPVSLEAGFIYIKARIRFTVPALETAGASQGYVNSWNISSPTQSNPWGTAANPSNRNNLDVVLQTVDPLGNNYSCLVFNTAGVYYVTWFSTGVALTTGTVTFGSGASTITGGDAWNTARHLTPSSQTDDLGFYLVSVPTGGGWMSYRNSGTHTNSGANFIRVTLTPYPLPITPALALGLDGMLEELSALKLELYKMKVSNLARTSVPRSTTSRTAPDFLGDVYETEGLSEESSVTETFNGPQYTTSGSVISTSETEQVVGPPPPPVPRVATFKEAVLGKVGGRPIPQPNDQAKARCELYSHNWKIVGAPVERKFRLECDRCQSTVFKDVSDPGLVPLRTEATHPPNQ